MSFEHLSKLFSNKIFESFLIQNFNEETTMSELYRLSSI